MPSAIVPRFSEVASPVRGHEQVSVLLSGAAALVFETLWFRQAGLTFGNSVWASSIVLASFMVGLGLGNGLAARIGPRVRRPVLAYAVLEVTVALAGVALVWVLPVMTGWLAPWLGPVLDRPLLVNPLRLGLATMLLLVPATAMGATLPLLVKALLRYEPSFGSALGLLYGWNTLGAVAGALAGEVVLLARFGVRGTAWCAAAANGIAALLALAIHLRTYPGGADASRVGRAVAAPVPSPSESAVGVPRLLLAAGLCGGLVLALEVVWFRFLLLFSESSNRSFAIMLAAVLAGIALGGLLGGAWLRWRSDAHRFGPALALLAGTLVIVLYAGFENLLGPYRVAMAWRFTDVARLALPLVLPVCLLSGVLFTLIGAALYETVRPEIRAAGLATLANTVGAGAGPLLAGFVLLPILGMERSFLLLAACYGAVALLLLRRPLLAGGIHSSVLAASGLAWVLSLSFFPTGAMRERYLEVSAGRFSFRKGPIVAVREGSATTAMYQAWNFLGEPLSYRLLTGPLAMADTSAYARRYMKLFVYLPQAMHPELREALLISFGVGSTAKALTDTRDLTSIDVVDVSREVIDLSRIAYPDLTEHPLGDHRVRLHIEDGRHFLQTTSRSFDLITSEPPPPKAAGIVTLYTQEYFHLIHDRLKPGGLVSYWLPTHSLTLDNTLSIIRAFCNVFEDCSLWNGFGLNWILMGSRDAGWKANLDHYRAQWEDPQVRRELVAVGLERPEMLGALFLAGPEHLEEVARNVLPAVDAWPMRVEGGRVDVRLAEETFGPWMDVSVARERFRSSELIRRLWPEEMIEASVAWFDEQAVVNDLGLARYPEGELWNHAEDLHHVLTETDLRTLPLWQLGLELEQVEIYERWVAKAAGEDVPALPAAFEARVSLARRDYRAAERQLRRDLARRRSDPWLTRAWLFALCMGGEEERARRIARQMPWPADRSDAGYRSFMQRRFGLPLWRPRLR